MIIGDPDRFAIEFEISEPYEDKHFLAMGIFIVLINGREYGLRKHDATTFGGAVDAVETLIEWRGRGAETDLSTMTAMAVAEAYLSAFYLDEPLVFREEQRETWQQKFLAANCLWPNSDEEFDDGSHILYFNLGNRIRLVAFKNDDCQLADLTEIMIDPEVFHDVLSRWLDCFNDQRHQALQPH